MKQPSFFLSQRFNSGLRVEKKDFFRHFEGADQTTGRYSWGAVKISNRTSTFSTSFYRSNISLQTWYLLYPPFLGGPSGLCFLKNVVAFYPWIPHRGIHGNLPEMSNGLASCLSLLLVSWYLDFKHFSLSGKIEWFHLTDLFRLLPLCFKPFQLMACSEGS